jgi:uncharacterized repeat protein (TIGR01451 family)
MSTGYSFFRLFFVLLVSVSIATIFFPTVSGAQTQPVIVRITQIEQLGDDFDVASLGDFYAKVTIDGTTQETSGFSFDGGFIVPSGPLIPDPPWVLTQDVPLGLTSVPVRIEILDSDGLLTGDDDQADLNPLGSKNVLDLEVDLLTGRWSGDVVWPQRCISGPISPDFDNRSVEVCFTIDTDSDGDGLLNSWEEVGVDVDDDGTVDITLPSTGAHPHRKDIFVEVDCLVAATHSHCPRQDAIIDAIQAFANAPVVNIDGTTGVQLHVDVGFLFGAGAFSVPGTGGVVGTYGSFGGGGDQIPEAGNEIIRSFNNPQGNGTEFADLRAAFFNNKRDLVYRYAIFGHQTNARKATNDCTSGEVNTIPGDAFFVTLGGNLTPTFPCWTADANGFSVGSRNEQAGTFMHELGHAIGLFHGGDQPLFNDKPNYLSVMNYSFQQCSVTPSPNGFLPGGCDYSRIALPPAVPPSTETSLVETSLDECVGIDRGQLGFGPVNWDRDTPAILEGATCPAPNTANVLADINNDGGALPIPLTGFDDWTNLQYSLVAIANGGGGSLPVEDEADPETIRQSREFMSALLAPGVVVDKSGPTTAQPGDVLTYTTQIRNQGYGPALQVVLTDTRPDGGAQVEDLNAVVVGGIVTRTSNFTVPLTACPGDFPSASAAVTFKDFVSNQLTASDVAPLQILDVAPPTLTVAVSPTTLWPPNHKFQNITATITVSDNCDPNPIVRLVSVVSNEPETGFLGNGDKGPDVEGADVGSDDRAFSLRSERGTGGQSTGRVYTITYRATDSSGNVRNVTATVTVPTSNSGH